MVESVEELSIYVCSFLFVIPLCSHPRSFCTLFYLNVVLSHPHETVQHENDLNTIWLAKKIYRCKFSMTLILYQMHRTHKHHTILFACSMCDNRIIIKLALSKFRDARRKDAKKVHKWAKVSCDMYIQR